MGMKESKANAKASQNPLEENDPLWNLLGEAPPPQPDAWFTVRTLARCRYETSTATPWWIVLRSIWRQALGVTLGLSLAIGLMMVQMHTATDVVNTSDNVQDAFEVMASLDYPDPDAPASSPSWQDAPSK